MELMEQALARAAGAPLVPGNAVRLLRDASENYPAWLDAIRSARHSVHFESYIIHEDAAGAEFAEALKARARDGVRVRVVYDWLGGVRSTSRRFWRDLRGAGVEVRCFNPPSIGSPFGWLSRDHRKSIVVDGQIAFVTSANLSQAAMDRNMELGILVRGGDIPNKLHRHLSALVTTGLVERV